MKLFKTLLDINSYLSDSFVAVTLNAAQMGAKLRGMEIVIEDLQLNMSTYIKALKRTDYSNA